MDRSLLVQALDDDRYDDFEDALQMACAQEWNAEIFVTRDKELTLQTGSI